MTVSPSFRLRLRAMSFASSESSFALGVGSVVGTSSEAKVRGTDAQTYVAAMQDTEARRDRAKGQLPRRPVGVYEQPARRIALDLAVATATGGLDWNCSTGPQPTRASFVHPTPEADSQRDARGNLGTRRRAEAIRVIGPAVPSVAVYWLTTLSTQQGHGRSGPHHGMVIVGRAA